MSSRKLIIFLICFGNISISFNTGAVAAAIPSISQYLALPDFDVAKVVPFYMIPYGIGALLYAPLIRFASYRSIAMGAMTLYALFSFLSGLSQTLDSLLFAQIGAGIAAASSTPLSLMIIGDFFDKESRGRLIGTYFGCSFFSSILGMLVMGIVDWRGLFYIPAVLGLLTALCYLCLPQDLLNRTHQGGINYFKAITDIPIRKVFLFIFAMSFLYHAVHKWYGVYLHRQYDLDKLAISWFLTIAALCGLAGQQIGGYFSDKKGRVWTCRLGMLILAFGILALGGHYPTSMVLIFISLIAMGWTMSHNSISTALTDFPDDDRPIIASLNSSVRFISGGLGFTASKFFVEKSFELTFFGIGLIILFLIYLLKSIFIHH